MSGWLNTSLKNLNLDRLAAQAGLSKFHFHRLFKSAMGVSPSRYHINLRMNLARQLLREKGLHDSTLIQLRASLKQAEETSEAVKTAIRREEERFRVKTAEALALKQSDLSRRIGISSSNSPSHYS